MSIRSLSRYGIAGVDPNIIHVSFSSFSPSKHRKLKLRVQGRITEGAGRVVTSSQRRPAVSQLPLAGAGPCVDRYMDMSEEET